MEIIIVGGGVGGLALACGLVSDGHAVRVLESADRPRAGGAAVTIYSNGAAALAGLGAPLPAGAGRVCGGPAGPTLGGRIDLIEARDARARRVFRADLSVLARATGFPVTTVPRTRLVGHLAARLPAGTVLYGQRVVRAGPDGTVHTADGVFHGDVVVGADGAHSAVRASVLDPAPPAEVGWTTWQGLTPVLPEFAAGTTCVLYVGGAGLVGMMPAGEGLTQWWFDVRGALPDGPVAAALRYRFAAYAGEVPGLLDPLTDDDIGRYPHVLHAVPDAWGSGRVTLLGDAAHAFPPSQAQGANQALEDAWLLRRAVAAGGTVELLRRYERLRAARVRRVSRLAASERTNRPVNSPARALVRLVPSGVAGRGYLSLLRGFSSVLRDERVA